MRKILLSPHMTHQAIGNLAELRYVRVRLHPDYDQKMLDNAARVIREVLLMEDDLNLESLYTKYWLELPFLIDSEGVSKLGAAGFLVQEIPHTALALLRGCAGFQDVAAADPRLGQTDYAALPLEQNNAIAHLVKMYRARFGVEMPEKQCDENGRYFFNVRVYED